MRVTIFSHVRKISKTFGWKCKVLRAEKDFNKACVRSDLLCPYNRAVFIKYFLDFINFCFYDNEEGYIMHSILEGSIVHYLYSKLDHQL